MQREPIVALPWQHWTLLYCWQPHLRQQWKRTHCYFYMVTMVTKSHHGVIFYVHCFVTFCFDKKKSVPWSRLQAIAQSALSCRGPWWHIQLWSNSTDWGVYSWPWQWFTLAKAVRPIKNTPGRSAVVFCAFDVIQLFFVVFCVVRVVH